MAYKNTPFPKQYTILSNKWGAVHITTQDFLDALEWVCEDPFDEEGRITREIGLEQNRIVRLQVFRDDSTGLMSLVDIEVLKKPLPHRWEGAWFADGFYRKILLSAKERV